MLCKVDGCSSPIRYKAACLCQMHYFRLRRYGTTDTTKAGHGKHRIVMPGGYIRIKIPGHPLADSKGWVAEHRAVVFADIGSGPMDCELCGIGLTWETVHIDHIDESRDNNVRSNLRPTCSTCNTRRGRGPEHTYAGRAAITWQGRTMTAHEWSREPGVEVSSTAIRARLARGQTTEQALFGPKQTHNGRQPQKKPPPPKASRRNAVNLTITGRTMTAAEWSRERGCAVAESTIRMRFRAGWDHQAAVFAPPRSSDRSEKPTAPGCAT